MGQDRDGMKSFDDILQVDDRNQIFVSVDRVTGERRRVTREDRYNMISEYGLHEGVPDKVATQYDVARDLYIYAWFEYRFYNVAEIQALMALEFALNIRIGKEALKAYIKDRKRKHRDATGKGIRISDGMKTLIEYCRDHKLIRNEHFTAWYAQPQKQAEMDMLMASISKMEKEGLQELEVDYSQAEYSSPSIDYDHVEHLVEYVNKIRNNYAHGSSMLHPNVLGTFVMVSEFINAIYQEERSV